MRFLSRAASTARVAVAAAALSFWPQQAISPLDETGGAEERYAALREAMPRDARLEDALDISERLYEHEQEVVRGYRDLRASLRDSSFDWRDPSISFRLHGFISSLDYYGREAANPDREETYAPGWDTLRRQFPHLAPMNCTDYVLSSYAEATGDSALLEAYHGEEYGWRSFPGRFLEHFRERGYEAIFVAPNADSTSGEYRYKNGSWHGGLSAISLRKIRDGSYYAAPYLDTALVGDGFRHARPFLESVSGIVALNDFYHLAFVEDGMIREAHWGSNPLVENTFEESGLYYELTKKGGREEGHNWRNAVLLVPGGSTELLGSYLENRE